MIIMTSNFCSQNSYKSLQHIGFLQMKNLVFANLRMIKDMAVRESLKKLNLDSVEITKVPTLPGRDERRL